MGDEAVASARRRLCSRRTGQAQLNERIKEIAAIRVRYGYRRVHGAAAPQGLASECQPRVPAVSRNGPAITPIRRPNAGQAKLRVDRRPARRSNETWVVDSVHDQLATGTKLRVLTLVDTFSRFSPAIEPQFNFRGADVVEVLERVGRLETTVPVIGLLAGTLTRGHWLHEIISEPAKVLEVYTAPAL